MNPLAELIAASLAFVGTHFALSHPLRAPLVARIGERGFLGVYSLVALATFAWMALAFRAAPAADLGGGPLEQIDWLFATIVTLPALLLFLGSLRGNPAFPGKGAPSGTAPTGVFAVTRHPMMWGFALWAIAHIVLWWDWRTVIVASTVLFLALVGAHLQDRKKAALMGDGWTAWESQTSYWPRWGRLPGAGIVLWLVTIALWLALTWAHIHAAGVPAGIWRWMS